MDRFIIPRYSKDDGNRLWQLRNNLSNTLRAKMIAKRVNHIESLEMLRVKELRLRDRIDRLVRDNSTLRYYSLLPFDKISCKDKDEGVFAIAYIQPNNVQ